MISSLTWNTMFTEYRKFLVFNFLEMGNPFFFYPKGWCKMIFFSMKCHVYWLQKSSFLKHFGDEKYGPFYPKIWWKDDTYLVFLSFPWCSRNWEMWILLQWMILLNQIRNISSMFRVPICPEGYHILSLYHEDIILNRSNNS